MDQARDGGLVLESLLQRRRGFERNEPGGLEVFAGKESSKGRSRCPCGNLLIHSLGRPGLALLERPSPLFAR
jgi:hypothetical protein